MQERRQQLKLPSAWQPDKWVCHHTTIEQPVFTNDHFHEHMNTQLLLSSENLNSSLKRIDTAELKERIDKLSLRTTEYGLSARKSKVKRLNDAQSPKSHRSLLSYASRRPLTPVLHIPKMSKQSLARWLDARDAYLGHQYPYIIDKFQRLRRRRKRQKSLATKEYYKMIDYEIISMFSMDSDRFTILEQLSNERKPQSNRTENPTKIINQFEGCSLHRSGTSFENVKACVQSPSVHSSSRLSFQKQEEKKTQIIHDHFDDKCIGTEISEPIRFHTNIERCDQAIQVNLARPQIELYHEFDTSMVEGEINHQQIRSIRQNVEYSDKATETEFTLNSLNVEKEKGEQKEENKVNDDDEDDKATRRSIKEEQEEIEPHNVQQQQQKEQVEEQYSLSQMSDINDCKTKKNTKLIPTSKSNRSHNRIVPLTDLLQTSTNDENDNKQNGSQTTMLTSTESNTSIQEQLQRYKETK